MNLQKLYKIGLAGIAIAFAVLVVLNIFSTADTFSELSPVLKLLVIVANIGLFAAFFSGGYLWFYYFGRVKNSYNFIVLFVYASSTFLGGLWAHFKFKNA